MRAVTLIALSLVLAGAVGAQPRVPAQAIVERWEAQQRQVRPSLESLRFTETIERDIDSPFVTRLVRLQYEVTLRRGQAERRLVEGSVDGERVEPEVVERMQRRIQKASGREAAAAAMIAEAPDRLLTTLQPVGRPLSERVGNGETWRAELQPRVPDESPVDRATLWFTGEASQPRLLRSRLVLRAAENGSVMTVTTRYTTLEGPQGPLAVGEHQTVEAAVQQRRRWRTYTVLVRSERRIEDLRPSWRAMQTGGR